MKRHKPPRIPLKFKHEYTAAQLIEYVHEHLMDQVDREGLFSFNKVDYSLLATIQEWRYHRYVCGSDFSRMMEAEERHLEKLREAKPQTAASEHYPQLPASDRRYLN